ncbi:MAG: Ppx/GppA phosphatase family protein [Thermodesulfobacteriota bacterium]|jgi:exopolyphosphatase/guanosine-5'-triphosphate,3'-diphosphate pyrophosphatase|nr:MAG: Ppx/GppA phosphatase family protein [Thermodesulfobacteriota bacterium]
MRVAAIDVGTNTVRLLIADYAGGRNFTSVFHKEMITRLGEGFSSRGVLSPEAMDRTLEALRDFKKSITKRKTNKIIAVATSVVRDAHNGKDFIDKVREQTGIEITLISGDTEAKLACRGALLPVDCEYDEAFIFDIGGGSTEFILTRMTDVLRVESIDLGVVHITEKYLHHDPPQEEELTAIEKIVATKIQTIKKQFQSASLYPFKRDHRIILIGIAGTPTTLAALDLQLAQYDRGKVTNHLVEIKRIKEIFQGLIVKTVAERLSLPGLQKGREDLIIPGIIIAMGVMEIFEFSALRVIDSGILEGLVLSYSSPGASIPCFSSR